MTLFLSRNENIFQNRRYSFIYPKNSLRRGRKTSFCLTSVTQFKRDSFSYCPSTMLNLYLNSGLSSALYQLPRMGMRCRKKWRVRHWTRSQWNEMMNNTELGEKFNISRTYIQKILCGNAAISGSAIATHQLPATASESSSEAVGCLRLLAL